jgi:hypothetical protein
MAKSIPAPITLLALAQVAAASAGTKGAPGANGSWFDISAYDGGEVALTILNGATGPSIAGSILLQQSPDNGTTAVDVQGFSGDTAAYTASTLVGLTTLSVRVSPGMKYIRVIGWGHTVQPVSYGAIFTGVVRS